MDELRNKIEELGRAVAQFKQSNDEAWAEQKKKGYTDPVLMAKVDKANADIDRLSTAKEALEKELKEVKDYMSRPGAQNSDPDSEKKALIAKRKEVMTKFLRTGDRSEFKTVSMSVDSQPDGGFAVSPEFATGVVQKVYETSAMRAIASVDQIGSDKLSIMADLDEASASWAGERETVSQTDTPRLKELDIVTEELRAYPFITMKALEDMDFDVEAWLMRKVADKFARKENTSFITGSGVKQPRGIMSYDAFTGDDNAALTPFGQVAQVVSGADGEVKADSLITLQNGIKEAYQPNARWLMRRATAGAIRKLKDGQGQYLWQPGLLNGEAQSLLGKPVHYFADIAAIASGALAIAYGDFREAYQIVDRIGISVLRNPFGTLGSVGYFTRKRVGGGVKNFEAYKIYKLSAS